MVCVHTSEPKVTALIEKACQGEGLLPDEVQILLQQSAPGLWDEIFSVATSLTTSHFHHTLSFFAPLYFSNYCINDCMYCGFRKSNRLLKRRVLREDEFIQEARFLWEMGHRNILLIAGEHPVYAGPGAIASFVGALKREGLQFSIMAELAPLKTSDYKILRDLGINRILLFQETYHRLSYARFHKGSKSDYDWRLRAMERALKAGIEKIGLGILLGLHPFREDMVELIRHAWYLKKEFGVFPATFSFPRIRPALGVSFSLHPEWPVGDDDYKKIVAVTRLAVPSAGIVLSTRESPEFRTRLLEEGIGITHMSAGSCTVPGGYTTGEKDNKGQFDVADHRPLAQVVSEIKNFGYQTCGTG